MHFDFACPFLLFNAKLLKLFDIVSTTITMFGINRELSLRDIYDPLNEIRVFNPVCVRSRGLPFLSIEIEKLSTRSSSAFFKLFFKPARNTARTCIVLHRVAISKISQRLILGAILEDQSRVASSAALLARCSPNHPRAYLSSEGRPILP